VAENPNGFFSASYGEGPVKFFEILNDWREAGELEGCEVR
jgi:hypothetical protein